jgi:hypothetical protein
MSGSLGERRGVRKVRLVIRGSLCLWLAWLSFEGARPLGLQAAAYRRRQLASPSSWALPELVGRHPHRSVDRDR